MSALQRDAREACDATPRLSAGRSFLVGKVSDFVDDLNTRLAL